MILFILIIRNDFKKIILIFKKFLNTFFAHIDAQKQQRKLF